MHWTIAEILKLPLRNVPPQKWRKHGRTYTGSGGSSCYISIRNTSYPTELSSQLGFVGKKDCNYNPRRLQHLTRSHYGQRRQWKAKYVFQRWGIQFGRLVFQFRTQLWLIRQPPLNNAPLEGQRTSAGIPGKQSIMPSGLTIPTDCLRTHLSTMNVPLKALVLGQIISNGKWREIFSSHFIPAR